MLLHEYYILEYLPYYIMQSLCIILNFQKESLTIVIKYYSCDNQTLVCSTEINNFPKRKDCCREQSSSKQTSIKLFISQMQKLVKPTVKRKLDKGWIAN